VQVATNPNVFVSAFVPQSDGSVAWIPGSITSPGIFGIPNVPTGYYWLNFSDNVDESPVTPADLSTGGYWTNASTIDAGLDIPGPYVPLNQGTPTSFSVSLSGLQPQLVTSGVYFDPVGVVGDTLFLLPNSNATSLQFDDSAGGLAEVNTAFFIQYVPSSVGGLNTMVLGPEVTDSNLSITNGANISETLQPTPQTSLNLNVSGAQWVDLLNQGAPVPVSPLGSEFILAALPFVKMGVNSATCLQPDGSSLLLATLEILPGFPCPEDFTGTSALYGLSFPPPILTNQALGILQYGDPFPAAWSRTLNFFQVAMVPLPAPGSDATVPFLLAGGETVVPSSSPLAPLVTPVQNPTINGRSLFTATTLSTTSPTLSWSPPSSGSPYGYLVQPCILYHLDNGSGETYGAAAAFYTAETSLRLFSLSPGSTYVFTISALVDGAANIETAPFRSALPNGYADLVSAPVTISSDATPTVIYDGEVGSSARHRPRLEFPKPGSVPRYHQR
jgi:hypothetical protein